MDLPGSEENLDLLRAELASEVIDIIPVKAAEGELGDLKAKLREMVEARRNSKFDF